MGFHCTCTVGQTIDQELFDNCLQGTGQILLRRQIVALYDGHMLAMIATQEY